MTFYALLLFFHVSGAVLVFVALGIEAVAVGQLREPIAVAPARSWNGVRRRSGWAGSIALAAVLASGIGMMAIRWGPQAWILTGFVGLLGIVGIGIVTALRAGTRFGAALGGDSQEIAGSSLRGAAESVMFSVRLRAGTGVAVLALMTIRPGLLGSIVMLAAAVTVVMVHRLATVAGRRSLPAEIAGS